MRLIEAYRNRMSAMGGYEGEVRRRNSQKIMDASWMRDVATKPVYVKWVDSGLPVVDDDDVPVYAKYNVKSYHNITGDEVAYLLQFRLEDMKNRPDIKVGSYVQIRNEMGEPEWWLLVHFDDRPQFRQWSILKCTWTYRWVSKVGGKRRIFECLVALRKQNSYNSGVWLDYTTQTVENQDVFWAPTNNDTKTIFYDTKFLKSEAGRMPPLAYKVSKIEDTATIGITKFTMTQEMFDPTHDNAELLIGNYYESAIEPEIKETEEIPTVSDLEIVYSGSPAVRAGGGYKKFTLKSRVGDKLIDCIDDIEWSIDSVDIDMVKFVTSVTDNVFKVKCTNDYSLIGKTFTITAQVENSSKSLIVEVISL